MPTVEQLQERLQSEPDDVFLNFGLAMAYRSAGRTEEAIAQFDRTCSLDENYVAAYFQKAILLAQTDETVLGFNLDNRVLNSLNHTFREVTCPSNGHSY